MPLAVLFPFLLLAGIALLPGRISRAAERVEAFLPTLDDVELPAPKPSGDVEAKISILQLRDARYRRGRPLEQWIEELDGKTVAIEGYMAIGTLEGLTEFELVPEDCECGKSKVNHFVLVKLAEDVTRFKPGRFWITGTFEAGEEIEDGFITSVYRLRALELPQ